MYAVIKTGGKQYRVAEGDVLQVEKVAGEAGDEIKFDQVLAVGEGESLKVGAPLVDGATVTAKVVEQGRGRKIRVIKFKRRKNYHRTAGHRQDLTKVEITAIAA